MRAVSTVLSTLVTFVILNPPTAFAAAAPAPERRVILASNAAFAVITEAKANEQFWFERCYLPKAQSKTVAEQLAAPDFKDCVEISRALTDNEATRAEFNRQFAESLNELFERHSRFAAVSRSVIAGVMGGFVGMMVPMLPVRGLHTTSVPRIVASSLITGAATSFVVGRYAMDHMDELGLGREVEESLDSDLAGDVILLDKQVKSAHQAREALQVFEFALDDATASTTAKHLN